MSKKENGLAHEDSVAYEALEVLTKHYKHPVLAQMSMCFDNGIVPFLEGPPGVAKSSLVYQYAESEGMDIIEFRPALEDLSGIKGLPNFKKDGDDTIVEWAIPAHFPRDPDWKGILFLDEVVKAAPSMQGALSQLVLDRKVGSYTLPKGALIALAGNRTKDRAAAFKMPSDLANRVSRLPVEFHVEAWSSWAKMADLPPVAIAFANFRSGLLASFDPTQDINCTPRTYTSACRLMEYPQDTAIPVMTGLIGEGPTVELMGFYRNWTSVPSLRAVLERGKDLGLPEDPSSIYATLAKLASEATVDNITKLFVYVGRFSVENQTMFWKQALGHNGKLISTATMMLWLGDNENFLIG